MLHYIQHRAGGGKGNEPGRFLLGVQACAASVRCHFAQGGGRYAVQLSGVGKQVLPVLDAGADVVVVLADLLVQLHPLFGEQPRRGIVFWQGYLAQEDGHGVLLLGGKGGGLGRFCPLVQNTVYRCRLVHLLPNPVPARRDASVGCHKPGLVCPGVVEMVNIGFYAG
jgi:hypothetical protein